MKKKGKGNEKILNSPRVTAGMAVLLLSMAFVLFVITAPVIAQPVKVWVNVPEYAAEGANFVATVDVDNLTDFNCGMFDLSFDSSVLIVTDVEEGHLDEETIPVGLWAHTEQNTIRAFLDIPGLTGVSGSGYLAKINFHAVGEEGDKSVLNLSNGELVNNKAEFIPAEWIDSEVRIVKGKAAPAANYVHNTNTRENFSSIQGAIDDPDTRDGDLIEVEDGVYYENVDVSKSLTIRSENGSANCIVHAAIPDDHVFDVTSGYVNISGFTVKGATDYEYAGIYLYYAYYCNIAKNNCSNNYAGITLVSSNNNSISKNNCSNNLFGIYQAHSNNNSISNNNCSNSPCGIGFINSKNNRIANNTCSNNPWGISLMDSNNNKIVNNTCSNSLCGIIIWLSNNNTLAGNALLETGIVIRGPSLSAYRHEIDAANTVNGKPVYYWKDVEGGRIPDGAGQVILVNCTNVTIEDQNLNNTSIGIQIAFSSSSTIKNNNCSNNLYGISLQESNNNCISNNNCLNNDDGIYFMYSNNNSIYLNNFINNANNVDSSGLVNAWGSTKEIIYTYNENNHTNFLGNYWSDYAGSDSDGDGIGDTPYCIGGCEKDRYPLMVPFENYFTPAEDIFETGTPENPDRSFLGIHNGTIMPIQAISLACQTDTHPYEEYNRRISSIRWE